MMTKNTRVKRIFKYSRQQTFSPLLLFMYIYSYLFIYIYLCIFIYIYTYISFFGFILFP